MNDTPIEKSFETTNLKPFSPREFKGYLALVTFTRRIPPFTPLPNLYWSDGLRWIPFLREGDRLSKRIEVKDGDTIGRDNIVYLVDTSVGPVSLFLENKPLATFEVNDLAPGNASNNFITLVVPAGMIAEGVEEPIIMTRSSMSLTIYNDGKRFHVV